jgi:hypothetical protein
MTKEDVYTLEGKLVRKPKSVDSYFATRKEVAKKLATAQVNGEDMFDRIGNVKLEDDKFTIPVKINRGAIFTGKVDKEYEQYSENWRREMIMDDAGMALEEHFGTGPTIEEGKTPEELQSNREERQKRLAEMNRRGILPISHFTSFEEKDFEA